LRNFCSGCPDVDVFFGSVGSFFEFEPEAGSFELFPPFVEEVLDKLAARLEQLLAKASGALSFVVVMPEWRDPLLPALSLLESSSWLRAHFPVSSRRQGMVSGTAFSTDPRESWRHLAFAEFHVYVLQNEAAAKQWPVTDAKLLLLKRALGQ
jgi:phosphorylated CTD-interacting factor 1